MQTAREPAGPQLERFFADVTDALRGLAVERRAEILADLRGHIRARWREESASGRTPDIEALLAELGQPAEIAAQAGAPAVGTEAAPAAGVDTLSVVAIALTVLIWPVGVIVAAATRRWRTTPLVLAFCTPLAGWGTVLASTMATTMSAGQLQGPTHVAAWAHVIVHVAILVLLSVGLFGTPIAAALYLSQTRWRATARPWIPCAALGLMILAGGAIALFK